MHAPVVKSVDARVERLLRSGSSHDKLRGMIHYIQRTSRVDNCMASWVLEGSSEYKAIKQAFIQTRNARMLLDHDLKNASHHFESALVTLLNARLHNMANHVAKEAGLEERMLEVMIERYDAAADKKSHLNMPAVYGGDRERQYAGQPVPFGRIPSNPTAIRDQKIDEKAALAWRSLENEDMVRARKLYSELITHYTYTKNYFKALKFADESGIQDTVSGICKAAIGYHKESNPAYALMYAARINDKTEIADLQDRIAKREGISLAEYEDRVKERKFASVAVFFPAKRYLFS